MRHIIVIYVGLFSSVPSSNSFQRNELYPPWFSLEFCVRQKLHEYDRFENSPKWWLLSFP